MSISAPLYRSLMRVGRRFDATPETKALLFRWIPKKLYNGARQEWQDPKTERDATVDKFLDDFLGPDADFYTPEPSASIADHIRAEFRGGSLEDLSAGFSVLRYLNDSYEVAKAQAEAAEMAEARVSPSIEGEIEHAAEVKDGIILVAHPISVDPCFGRTIMVLAAHEDDRSRLEEMDGSVGFVLNKPAGFSLGEVRHFFKQDDWQEILDCFSSEELYIGGPCPTGVAAVHSIEELAKDSAKICDGLYYGGLECMRSACKMIEEGNAKPADFKVIFGTALWGPSQLMGEIQKGHWILAKGNQDALRYVCERRFQSKKIGHTDINFDKLTVSHDGAAIWGEILKRLGGEYEDFSKLAHVQREAHDIMMNFWMSLEEMPEEDA